ncbi:MAG: GntR family transcriptional regulator [Bacteroidales bacterium]|nr:GntR family transcriptional regulator [Bacteroidales bacterium]
MQKKEKLLKPAQFAENEIIKAIVSNEWPAGYKVIPERELSELIGVTRPTLREVLQRLSRDGWLTITHGRSTIVNDYKTKGGLGVLKTLVNHSMLSSAKLIEDWLEFRILILPGLAKKAIEKDSSQIVKMLNQAPSIEAKSEEFARFDWEIQILLINTSENSIAKMLYNDLSSIYYKESTLYFNDLHTKKKSSQYYKYLLDSIISNKDIGNIVELSMIESYNIWKRINQKK